jgi:hypothetical protein
MQVQDIERLDARNEGSLGGNLGTRNSARGFCVRVKKQVCEKRSWRSWKIGSRRTKTALQLASKGASVDRGPATLTGQPSSTLARENRSGNFLPKNRCSPVGRWPAVVRTGEHFWRLERPIAVSASLGRCRDWRCHPVASRNYGRLHAV